MWSKVMRIFRRLLQRKTVVIPSLPQPNVPYYNRNDIEHLKAYDKELRVRALDLEARVIGRHQSNG